MGRLLIDVFQALHEEPQNLGNLLDRETFRMDLQRLPVQFQELPAKQEVAAAAPITSTVILPEAKPLDEATFLDFAHIKKQLPIARLLDHLLAAGEFGVGSTAPQPGHFTRLPASSSFTRRRLPQWHVTLTGIRSPLVCRRTTKFTCCGGW